MGRVTRTWLHANKFNTGPPTYGPSPAESFPWLAVHFSADGYRMNLSMQYRVTAVRGKRFTYSCIPHVPSLPCLLELRNDRPIKPRASSVAETANAFGPSRYNLCTRMGPSSRLCQTLWHLLYLRHASYFYCFVHALYNTIEIHLI